MNSIVLASIAALLLVPSSVFADGGRYDSLIRKHAANNGLDFHLVKSLIRAESAFDARIVSHKGAQGLMQLIPATARRFGVKNAFSADENIKGGTAYLSWLLKRFNGNVDLALAGYNAGEGRVDQYGGVPPYKETIKYIARIKRFYREYKGLPYVRTTAKSASKRLTDNDVELAAIALGLLKATGKKPAKKQKPKAVPVVMAKVGIVPDKAPQLQVRARESHTRIHSLTSQLGRLKPADQVTRYRSQAKRDVIQ